MKTTIIILFCILTFLNNKILSQSLPFSKPVTGFENVNLSDQTSSEKPDFTNYNFESITLNSSSVYFYNIPVSSYFDIQSNSVPHTIWQDPLRPSNIHAVFMTSPNPSSIYRSVQYLFSSNFGVSWIIRSYVPPNGPDIKTGFPSIDGLSNGAALIAHHGVLFYPDNLRTRIYYDSGPGVGEFTILDPGISQRVWWPVIVATSNITNERKFVFAASDAATAYTNTGISLTAPGIFSGYSYNAGRIIDYSLARSSDGRIGHAYSGINENIHDAFFRESNDDGLTWSLPIKIWDWNTNDDSLGVLMGISVVYKDTTPVVAFNTMHLTEISYSPGRPSQIRIWNPAVNAGNPVTVADSSVIPFFPVKTRISDDFTSLCRPSIGCSSDGNVITVAFSGANGFYEILNNDTTTYFSGYTALSSNGGESWYGISRITPLQPLLDWRYISVSKSNQVINNELTVQMVCQNDTKAGSYIITGSNPGIASLTGIRLVAPVKASPTMPQLLSPVNFAVHQLVRPTFYWDISSNAITYDLQISNDSLFGSTVLNKNGILTNSFLLSFDLLYDTTYFWRVRAVNSFGFSLWTPDWNFRTTTFLPPAPALVTPLNDSTEISLTPLLSWNASPYANTYNLQVSTDSTFNTTQIDLSGLTVLSYNIPSGSLLYDSSYYWRVNANNFNGTSEWSSLWKFSTISTPITPVLIAPLNNSSGIIINPLLRWQSINNAENYRVQVSTDSNFSMTILDSLVTISEIQIQPETFTFNRKYYWRVNASNIAGTGNWTEIWNFTTTTLYPPLLSYPQNGSGNIPIASYFFWNNVTGASSFTIQITTDSTFKFLTHDQQNLACCQYFSNPVLMYDTNYYWRMRSISNADTSDWSSVWKFRTRLPVDIVQITTKIPTEYMLYSNYPNPFNPITKIRFDLPNSAHVKISFFDIVGKEVSASFEDDLSEGKFEYVFSSQKLNSGVYFYRIQAENFISVKKMIVLK